MRVQVISVDSFNRYAAKNRKGEALFYQKLCENLAQILQRLQSRDLSLECMSTSISGQQIYNEVVMCTWPAAVPSTFGKQSGSLLLSRNYISFLKKKNTEKTGVVSDASDVPNQVILEIMKLTEMSFFKDKVTLRDHHQKLVVHVKHPKDIQQARDILSTAKASRTESLTLPTSNNPNNTNTPTPDVDTLLSVDITYLLKEFKTKTLRPGDIIRRAGTIAVNVDYVVSGTCKVYHSEDGRLVDLPQLTAGDLLDEIGAFLGVPIANDVTAGENGCEILSIPRKVLSEMSLNDQSKFLGRVFFTIIQLMWNRVRKQEQNQMAKWRKQTSKV